MNRDLLGIRRIRNLHLKHSSLVGKYKIHDLGILAEDADFRMPHLACLRCLMLVPTALDLLRLQPASSEFSNGASFLLH